MIPSDKDQQFSLFELDLDPAVEDRKSATMPSGRYSNFIVYVDESGDHGMQNVDPNYPLFVLAFCVFYKKHYSEKVVPALEKFKFNNFGHDIVILHEREIRKETGPFKFANETEKLTFIDGLSDIIEVRPSGRLFIDKGYPLEEEEANAFAQAALSDPEAGKKLFEQCRYAVQSFTQQPDFERHLGNMVGALASWSSAISEPRMVDAKRQQAET